MARLDLGAIGLHAFTLLFYVLPKSTTRRFLQQAQTSANGPWILVAPSMQGSEGQEVVNHFLLLVLPKEAREDKRFGLLQYWGKRSSFWVTRLN